MGVLAHEKTNSILMDAYSAERFQEDSLAMTKLISGQLAAMQAAQPQKTLYWESPEEQLEFWTQELASRNPATLGELSQKILERSINFHSRGYTGHQVAATLLSQLWPMS